MKTRSINLLMVTTLLLALLATPTLAVITAQPEAILPNKCPDASKCAFSGFLNVSTGGSELSLLSVPSPSGQFAEVLRVKNMHPDAPFGVTQYVPNSIDMDTRLVTPNFSLSRRGASLLTIQRGTVDGLVDQVFSSFSVDNRGTRLDLEANYSFIGAKSYRIKLYNGDSLVTDAAGLRRGHMWIPIGDLSGEECNIDDDGNILITGDVPNPTIFTITGVGEFLADNWEIFSEGHSRQPLVQTSIEMVASNLDELQILQETTIPPPNAKDCNRNGLPDYGDIASGASLNVLSNRVPDECDLAWKPAMPNAVIGNNACTFDGFLNTASRNVTLTLEQFGTQEVLKIDGTGSQMRLLQYVPETIDMDTRLVSPNFSLSAPGASLVTYQTGIVDGQPGQRFSSFRISNEMTEEGPMLRLKTDFSYINTESYRIMLYNGAYLVADEVGLPEGSFWTRVVDISGEDCRLDRCGNIIVTGGTTTIAPLLIPDRGTFLADNWEVFSEGHDRLPTAQTEILMVAKNTGPLTLLQEKTEPDPTAKDCNGNRIPDWTDIYRKKSLDLDLNGIPDECS